MQALLAFVWVCARAHVCVVHTQERIEVTLFILLSFEIQVSGIGFEARLGCVYPDVDSVLFAILRALDLQPLKNFNSSRTSTRCD